MKPEHGKVITTESYYDGNLSHTKQEFEVSLFTDNNTIIKDIIDGLGVLTKGETDRVQFDITVQNGKYRLIRRWTA